MSPRSSILSMSLLGFVISGSLSAETTRPEEKPPILVEISCHKTVFKRGEKIILRIDTSNASGGSVPVLVRGCDWKDLDEMDRRFQKAPEFLKKKFGNIADRWRAEGLPRPLGVLTFIHQDQTGSKPQKAYDEIFGCGTGLKQGIMPPGTATTHFVHVDAAEKAPGKYKVFWQLHPPREWRKGTSKASLPAGAITSSNEIEIEILEDDSPAAVAESR